MEKKASVGRIVHYKSYGTPNGEYKSECRAAMITFVHDTPEKGVFNVSLTVFNPEGLFLNKFVAQDQDEKKGGTWHWPEQV